MADILVVDDNRANREALASLLEVAGHSARLTGVVPSILRPQLLWTADTLGVAGPPATR